MFVTTSQRMVNRRKNNEFCLLTYYRHYAYSNPMKADDLKRWRQRTGYSQGQLARVLRVDVMSISRWERGLINIPHYLEYALAYIEMKGEEFKPQMRTRTEKKGGK